VPIRPTGVFAATELHDFAERQASLPLSRHCSKHETTIQLLTEPVQVMHPLDEQLEDVEAKLGKHNEVLAWTFLWLLIVRAAHCELLFASLSAPALPWP